MSFEITEEAERQLLDIYVQGILTFGEEQAKRYQQGLNHIFKLLSFQPSMGRRIKTHENLRLFPFGQHLVVYESLEGAVRILSVIDGRSDFDL